MKRIYQRGIILSKFGINTPGIEKAFAAEIKPFLRPTLTTEEQVAIRRLLICEMLDFVGSDQTVTISTLARYKSPGTETLKQFFVPAFLDRLEHTYSPLKAFIAVGTVIIQEQLRVANVLKPGAVVYYIDSLHFGLIKIGIEYPDAFVVSQFLEDNFHED